MLIIKVEKDKEWEGSRAVGGIFEDSTRMEFSLKAPHQGAGRAPLEPYATRESTSGVSKGR